MISLAVSTRRIGLVCVFVAIAISVAMLSATCLPSETSVTAGLAIFCIGLWATSVVPEFWTALAFFVAAITLVGAPAGTVFSGFTTSTFWLLFSGLVLSSAIRFTGLGQRGARVLSRVFRQSYVGTIAGICGLAVVMAFVMPSAVGRVVLLIPIVAALAEEMGYEAGSNGRIGVLTTAAFGTFLPAFAILPANVPNMMLTGMAETMFGLHISYWDYLLLHFPVLGLLKAVVLVIVVVRLFPDQDPVLPKRQDDVRQSLSVQEYVLLVVLTACLVGWFTDSWHHIPAGWIGLAAALICLWPQGGLCPENCLRADINYGSLFFVAGIMGLGAVISYTGLGKAVVQGMATVVDLSQDSSPYQALAHLTGMSTLVGLVTSMPGVPSVMSPVAEGLAAISNLPLESVLMTQVLAFSSVVLPYQAPPLVMAMQLGHISHRAMTRLCLIMFVITVFLLLPLDALWWEMFGMI